MSKIFGLRYLEKASTEGVGIIGGRTIIVAGPDGTYTVDGKRADDLPQPPPPPPK